MKFLRHFKVINRMKFWKIYLPVTFRKIDRQTYGYAIHTHFIEEIYMIQFKRSLMIWSLLFLLPVVSLAFDQNDPVSPIDQDVTEFRAFCEKELAEARQLFHDLEKYQGSKTVKTVLIPLNEISSLLL